jgi:tryptophanyl-tRNA synthetase
MEQKQKKIILTGDRPTGKLHLGHYVGSILNRVKLQEEHEQFIIIADMQALTDNAEHPEKVRNNIMEVAMDYLAAGIDPRKSTIFIQSFIPEISELAMYFMNLVTLARAERNPTVKDEMKQKGYGNNVPVGFLAYPMSQAADILAFKADLVPVGEDQEPMIEQTNEIVEKFNRIYQPIFSPVKALISEAPRLPSIDGKAKMSKSLGNTILISDDDATISQRVMAMYTDPKHIRAEDPGTIDGNVVFSYLDIFDPDKKEVARLKANYREGGLGDVVLKKRLTAILQEVIRPMRERRAELAEDPAAVRRILQEGTERARTVVAATLRDVKHAMQIDYFDENFPTCDAGKIIEVRPR